MDTVKRIILSLAAIAAAVACRKEQELVPATCQGIENANPASCKFYLVNEGNMGSNKCTIDFYDGKEYWKNIFGSRNPDVSLGLGDVGNDIAIYGGKLYVVVNCSNLVEVMDAVSAKHIGQISIANCRYICFDGGFAYVSSYAGEIHDTPADRTGFVAKIDTTNLSIVGKCEVGYQPEELAVAEGKLYVANSGGYNAPDYDDRVSVIDLESFEIVHNINVAINLHHIVKTPDGKLWVTSRGDYGTTASSIHIIDPKTDSVVQSLDIQCSGLAYSDGKMYIYSYDYSSHSKYQVIDTESKEIIDDNFIEDNIRTPYGIAADPVSGDIYIMDAADYVTPGSLRCYSAEGKKRWEVTTGDIPSRVAFIIP